MLIQVDKFMICCPIGKFIVSTQLLSKWRAHCQHCWFVMVRQTGKLPPAHFYLGWQRTDIERRPTAVGRFGGRSADRQRSKKTAFGRGGPVWPPRSNAKDGRSGGALPPQAKNREVWGCCPPQQKLFRKDDKLKKGKKKNT